MKSSTLRNDIHWKKGPPSSPVSGWARRLFSMKLSSLKGGTVRLIEEDSPEVTLGERSEAPSQEVTLHVHDPRFFRIAVMGGTIGVAEAYRDGLWSSDQLVELIRLFARNQELTRKLDRGMALWVQKSLRWWHAMNRNTKAGSRRNIGAHYDLSPEFFKLFLDETMTYSCGIFDKPRSSLKSASLAKIDRLCRKLELTSTDHLLEIGTGWGAFAIYAASQFGCRVTTTTVSREQFDYAKARVKEQGLEDRVEVLFQDYRDLRGSFDKVVSVEMIEAVGHQYYKPFFSQCARLLKPDGVMAMQAITIEDRFFERAKNQVDFIKRFIFPGSCIPSVSALLDAMRDGSDFKLSHLEDITPHYVTTLRLWRQSLRDRQEEALALGFDSSFLRLWDFYFAYCEGGFAERHIGNVQMVFTKSGSRRTPSLPSTAGAMS